MSTRRKFKMTEERKLLLAEVQSTQTAFWNALSELEGELGVEIDGNQDFENVSDLNDLQLEED
jgi:hypothetical protein